LREVIVSPPRCVAAIIAQGRAFRHRAAQAFYRGRVNSTRL
jgi:hypothetical protein